MSMRTNLWRGPAAAATWVLLLSACGEQTGRSTTENVATAPGSAAVAAPTQVCYQQVVGRDTTRVRLVLNGAAVTGELAVLPADKDRAQGPFQGTLAGNQVVADWQRSGEGVTQVHAVTFTLAGDSLRWREGARTEKQGKWVLVNPNQGFEYTLTKIACPPRP